MSGEAEPIEKRLITVTVGCMPRDEESHDRWYCQAAIDGESEEWLLGYGADPLAAALDFARDAYYELMKSTPAASLTTEDGKQ